MSNIKESERTELHKTIWRIANDLRGSVDGWDFKTYVLGIIIAEQGIVEIQVACPAFLLIQVGGEVLRDEAVEQHAEYIGFASMCNFLDV